MLQVPIILLAAGGSTRLGHPKQLLMHGDRTLLRHVAETALAAELGPVLVILGAVVEPCREALLGVPVTIHINAAWQEGMGTSIALGAQSLDAAEHRAAIIMLCDQPGITVAHLRGLDQLQRSSGCSIVPSRFQDTLGPPALLTSKHFPELRELRGHQGAKALLHRNADVAALACPEAAVDIDKPQDLVALQPSSICQR